VFAAVQNLRVPTNDVFMRSVYEAGATDLMEMMFSNVDRARASLRRYERDTGKTVKVSAESMVDSVKLGKTGLRTCTIDQTLHFSC
jgi:hypothetical protein